MEKSYLKTSLALSLAIVMLFAGGLFAQATIGGSIYSGARDGSGNPIFAPDPATPPITDAQVMVQNQHHGGPFITWATVTGNTWTASVPAPGDYVVMFSAPGHDQTSREFTVKPGDTILKDAYLPPFFKEPDGITPSPNKLPLANLLVNAFYDNMVNGEPDAFDMEDFRLNGVVWYITDEDGDTLAVGVTGSQASITTTDTPPIVMADTRGLYYFTDLPPGEVIATSSADFAYLAGDPSATSVKVAGAFPPVDFSTIPKNTWTLAGAPPVVIDYGWDASTEFYLNYTEEGGPAWDPKLFPGDPGTEAGAFLIWHSYVEKLGQITPVNIPDRFPPGTPTTGLGTITGTLVDADKPNLDPDEPFPVPGEDHPGVTLNDVVADGLVILFTDNETVFTHPVATVEPDPVTGYFEFHNVPPGSYKMMMFDVPLNYVWTQQQVRIAPGQTVAFPLNTLLVPRFFARGQGIVYDNSTVPPTPVPGATVHIRYKDGSIQKTRITSDGTDGNPVGWYNFNSLPEIEVIGFVDVEPPPGYHGQIRTEDFYPNGRPGNTGGKPLVVLPVTFNAQSRYIQWLTANYRADLYIEPIPATTGDINGFVFNDHFESGPWTADGLYDPGEERTMHGVTVELWDATGTTLLATTTTGKFDKAATLAQGWREPYTWPADELGGVFVGPQIGFYEFRDLAPGSYMVKIYPGEDFPPPAPFSDPALAGFSASPAGSYSALIAVTGGAATEHDFGVNTTPATATFGVPLAGEIEGGIFDDVNIDTRGGSLTADPTDTQSLLWMEKAGVDHAPVGVYDHLGYLLGVGIMGNPLCYSGAPLDPVTGLPQCPDCDQWEPIQKPEMERRFASGVHIYVGNDPSFLRGEDLNCNGILDPGEDLNTNGVLDPGFNPDHPDWGFNPDYLPLTLPYTFGQGKFKFEADWSLIPTAFAEGPMGNGVLNPANQPVINGGVPLAALEELDETRYADAGTPQGQNVILEYIRSLRAARDGKGVPMFASTAASGQNIGLPAWLRNSAWRAPNLALSPAAPPAPMPVAPVTVKVGKVFRILGSNFGDDQGFSRVTLAGKNLKIKYWTDTYIDVLIKNKKALEGAIVVCTSTGLSNALPVTVKHKKAKTAKKLKKVSVWVDASNTGPEDGSKAHPWNTINEALDHLPKTKKHKYVYVAAGEYRERLQIKVDQLHLIGAGPHETIINGIPAPMPGGAPSLLISQGVVGYGPVIYIGGNPRDNGEVEKITITGFTITGGTVKDEIGCGIFSSFNNHDIDINTNRIVRNGGYYGGGIWMHHSNHDIRIHSNVIAENGNYGGYGGGISINDEPEIDDQVEFHGEPEHTVDDLNPGPPPGTYRVYNNLIFHNWSADYGGAMCFYELKDRMEIFGNVMIENNAEDHGGAMFFEDCGPVELFGNVFLRNHSPDDGGAVSFEDVGDTLSHVNIYNNLFAQNIADDHGENHARGGALAFDDTFYAKVFNNTIVGNIVAGSEEPAGGGIDSERNGHEYNGADGPEIAPGYSDPQVYNNIIYGNWRLKYDQPIHSEEEDLDLSFGRNYQWFVDEMHVDNPALQPEWESHNNSESFTTVHYNDIRGGYTAGTHNIDVDPSFVDPSTFNYRLLGGSPAIDHALYKIPGMKIKYDLEDFRRKKKHGKIDMGAFEWRADSKTVIRIPAGILGSIHYPNVGAPSPND